MTLASLPIPPEAASFAWPMLLAPIGSIAALATAFVFSGFIRRQPEGDEEMVRIAEAVRTGAMAYLGRQYRVVGVVFAGLVVALGVLVAFDMQPAIAMVGVPVAGVLSALTGYIGMRTATAASARTAHACEKSLDNGLRIAFRAGAVMGLVVVGFALADLSLWYATLSTLGLGTPANITTVMLSFGMGASTQALFARVGGGIYTKAADVGADLVGKVEAGVPEDDPRNPATIADNVGDNVGDVAGMGADLYESYYGSILATMALGAAGAMTLPGLSESERLAAAGTLAVAPLAIAGVGVLCSIAGIFAVRTQAGANFHQLLGALHRGVYLASGLVAIAAFFVLRALLGPAEDSALPFNFIGLGGAIVTGLIAGVVIASATERATSYEYRATKDIVQQAATGPATVIISGIAEGMQSTWVSLVTVVVAILGAFTFAGGNEHFLLGLFGVGIAAVGMLSTLGVTLATDAYGPIADNAGGNAEMTGKPPHVRERTDTLDSLGNTTAATGKGFAIGSAALTALALFAAYIQVVQVQLDQQSEKFARAYDVVIVDAEHSVAIYQGGGRFALVHGDADDRAYGAGLTRAELPRDITRNLRENALFELVPMMPGQPMEEAADLIAVGFVGDPPQPVEIPLKTVASSGIRDILSFYDVSLANPRLLGGVFIGVMLAFVFCAMTMKAVGRAASRMMGECRRQFGIMRAALSEQGHSAETIADPTRWPTIIETPEGTFPDYASCVSISTTGAQREMIAPAAIAICVPIALGCTLGVPAVMGMLAGGLTSGFALAVFMANAGGAWDNAKKLVESAGRITAVDAVSDPSTMQRVPENLRESVRDHATRALDDGKPGELVYGKGSAMHKATVVGDTVGDPFKDTSGPSLNILIKLISIVSIVFVGLTVSVSPKVMDLLNLN